MSHKIIEIIRFYQKKGDKEFYDFKFNNAFKSTDTILNADVTTTITPSDVTHVSAQDAISGLVVQRVFDTTSGVLYKEYLVTVDAKSSSGLEKTLEMVIVVI